MTLSTLAAIGLAFSLDLLIGEPPRQVHPVAWFGTLVAAVDREWSESRRITQLIGGVIAIVLPLIAATVVGLTVAAGFAIYPTLGAALAAIVLFLTMSLRMLVDLTRAVIDATGGEHRGGSVTDGGGTIASGDGRVVDRMGSDLEDARAEARGLVGRETGDLSAPEIRSAAIESPAENLADGFASTLLPFALLAPISLPLAAAAAAWIKAVNTLDSMLGYRSKPIGTASARLDDAVMYLPARITALCLALAAFRPGSLVAAREWARVPASPNSGWPMATLACALGVRLEKRGAYVLNPEADLPSVTDGHRAVSTVGLAATLLVAIAAALAVYAPALESLFGSLAVVALAFAADAVVSLPDVFYNALESSGELSQRLCNSIRLSVREMLLTVTAAMDVRSIA